MNVNDASYLIMVCCIENSCLCPRQIPRLHPSAWKFGQMCPEDRGSTEHADDTNKASRLVTKIPRVEISAKTTHL